MWPTGSVSRWRAAGNSGDVPIGPAMTTLRSVIAYLASMIRCTGIVYIVVQIILWHAFYMAVAWRLAGPVLAVAWAVLVTVYLRRRRPSPFLACADSAVYIALALCAQQCVPPAVRDDMFSWLVIAMSGQLIVPAWYAPGMVSVVLTFISPMAFWAGAALQPVTDTRTLAEAATLLLIIGLVHRYGRRVLCGRAAVADAGLDRADRAARAQYAILRARIERREHERLVHDTVLNTLTALTRTGGVAVAGVASRCRQDVDLIAGALADPDELAADGGRPVGDLLSEVRAVAAHMRARGLRVHVETDDGGGRDVPPRVVMAVSNAVREALSNVAAHAGTGEAWVSARLTAPDGDADVPCRLQVTVRDRGIGFDPARVDRARLGLRRSIAERTAECGGQAGIWSQPGQGTVVSLSWPASDVSEPPAWPDPAGQALADRGLAPEGPSW
jgi:signal transduction histidine kinase